MVLDHQVSYFSTRDHSNVTILSETVMNKCLCVGIISLGLMPIYPLVLSINHIDNLLFNSIVEAFKTYLVAIVSIEAVFESSPQMLLNGYPVLYGHESMAMQNITIMLDSFTFPEKNSSVMDKKMTRGRIYCIQLETD